MYAAGQPTPSAPPPRPPEPVAPHMDAFGNAPLGVYHAIEPRTLSLAAFYYLDDIEGRVSKSTMKESRFILRLLQDIVGDRLVHTFGTDDMRSFVSALKGWPSNAGKNKRLSGLSPKKIVAFTKEKGLKVIATSTCQKHIDHARAFFRWCKTNAHLVADLLAGARRNAVTATPAIKKKAFDNADLLGIFDRAQMEGYWEPHKYWVPLIGLFMGMRVNEICQLHIDDVTTDLIPTISISDERPGQRIKTKSGRRLVPIHPKLIELGLLDYVRDVRKTGAQHLFPGLKWGENGPGETVAHWFNRTLLKACGITTKQKTLHSLRHTFCTAAERKKVAIHRIARLVGHAPSGDVTLEHYINEAEVQECLKDIKKVVFPKLDLPRYASGQFRDYLMHVTASGYEPGKRKARKDSEIRDEDVLSMLL
nr:site-specific integrase [Luteibacter rhizovicinus]